MTYHASYARLAGRSALYGPGPEGSGRRCTGGEGSATPTSLADANAIFIVSLLVIALGALLKRVGALRDEDGQTLARVALNVTLPAVVLSTVPSIALDASLALLPLIGLVHCSAVLTLAFRIFRHEADRTRAVLLMTSTGFNVALFAFPIVEALWGAAGLQRLAMFDAGNAIVLLGVNYLIASWYGTRAAGGVPKLTLGFVGANLLKSAPLVSFAVAIVLNLLHLRLPPLAASLVGILAKANTPVVLLLLGVYLDLRLSRSELGHLAAILALRYGAGAVTGLACWFLLPFGAEYRTILLVGLLLPVGTSVSAFAGTFGLDRRLASIITNVTLLVSFGLMWLIATVL